MTQPRWTEFTYPTDPQLPATGELILLRYPIGLIPFAYGPASTYSASANTSHAYSALSSSSRGTKPRRIKSTLHYVLILDARHDTPSNRIHVDFLPIMSYTNPPSNMVRAGFTGTWSGERWMYQTATDVQRLHHLPVPAAGWTPPASVPSAPVVSFGGWLNTRPSWLALTVVNHDIVEGDVWCRHPGGPVMYEGEMTRLLLFVLSSLPRLRYELALASALATTNTTVNSVTLPSYTNVWANMFGTSYHCDIDPSSSEYTANGPVTESEMARALAGEDGVDPEAYCDTLNFWGHPGAPMEMVAMSQAHAKFEKDVQIWNWDEGCREEGHEVFMLDCEREDCDLDVPDVAFGETACPEM